MDAFTNAREDTTQADGDPEWAWQQLAAARSRVDGLAERRATAATRLEVVLGESAALIASTQAQQLGFAEADPTFDVSGRDAAQKLLILASLAFGVRLRPQDVPAELEKAPA
jgi:hypothetical protein